MTIPTAPRPTLFQAAQRPPLASSAKMDVLERAMHAPECEQAQKDLEAMRIQLSQLGTRTIDEKAYVGQAMSKYGIFALCLPAFAAMWALPQMGLPAGWPSMVGLVGGLFGAPAAALWAVTASGRSDAREARAALETEKDQAQKKITAGEARLEDIRRRALDRILAEERQKPAEDPADIVATEEQVQIGAVSVGRRGGNPSPVE